MNYENKLSITHRSVLLWISRFTESRDHDQICLEQDVETQSITLSQRQPKQLVAPVFIPPPFLHILTIDIKAVI